MCKRVLDKQRQLKMRIRAFIVCFSHGFDCIQVQAYVCEFSCIYERACTCFACMYAYMYPFGFHSYVSIFACIRVCVFCIQQQSDQTRAKVCCIHISKRHFLMKRVYKLMVVFIGVHVSIHVRILTCRHTCTYSLTYISPREH